MRYEPGFLIESLLLKMKSPKAYRYLRENKILPLPELSTIQRILSSSNCSFGFSELALDNLKKMLMGLPRHLRYGTLMFDEMSIRKDLAWDSKMQKWNGITSVGSEITENVQEGIADHVLVLLFQPFRQPWVQTIAWFATKGAASQHILSEIIMKSVIMIHRSCGIVKALVCDGATTNKAALNKLNVNGKERRGKHFFLHPLDANIKIYCFIDVPHLIKTTRNHILTHQNVQVILVVCQTYSFLIQIFTVLWAHRKSCLLPKSV